MRCCESQRGNRLLFKRKGSPEILSPHGSLMRMAIGRNFKIENAKRTILRLKTLVVAPVGSMVTHHLFMIRNDICLFGLNRPTFANQLLLVFLEGF